MELEELLASFRSANQSLRKRAIALGILMIMAIALRYSENVRFEKVSNLLGYQYALEHIVELSDSNFRAVVNGDFHLEQKYFLNEKNDDDGLRYRLFEKIRYNDYKRDLVHKEIDDISQKIETYNQQQSIGILGLTIPLEPVAYLSLVFVLIMFHDFTQIMIVRNRIYRRIRGQNLSQWKLGFEFFGFYGPTTNSTIRFLRFTSSLITAVLIVCPLITSYLMMDLNNSRNGFLFLLNIICLLLIVIDTIIIFHTENIGDFRYWCNFFLGRHNISEFKMRFFWAFSFSLILAINIAIGIVLVQHLGISGGWYCLMSVVPPTLLFLSLIYARKNPTKRIRAIRAGSIMLYIFWVFTTYWTFSFIGRLSEEGIDELGYTFFTVTILCSLYSFVYMKFFMDGRKMNKKFKR